MVISPGTVMGPGFFIFFQQGYGGNPKTVVYLDETKDNDDDEVIELIKIAFNFLRRDDGQ